MRSRLFSKIQSATVVLLLLAGSAHATSSALCNQALLPQSFDSSAADDVELQKAIDHLGEKYPTLERAVRDPQGFVDEMDRRFEQAKITSPENPLAFDYSEIGMVAVKQMKDMLPGKFSFLKELRETALANGVLPYWLPKSAGKLLPKSLKMKLGRDLAGEIDIGVKYLNELKADIDAATAAGKINYDQIMRLSYFFSRAIGYFDRYSFTSKFKVLMLSEYLLQGYRDHAIEMEYNLYKTGDFHLFEYKSINGPTRRAADKLEEAYANKEKLTALFLPTSSALDLDIFYRLQPYFLNALGITDVPLPADGVLRHGGLFFQHDVGHSAIMYDEMSNYLDQFEKTDLPIVRNQLFKWYNDFTNAAAAIEDPELRETVQLLAFNIHHERGFPVAPSTFVHLKRMPASGFLLYFIMERTGQGLGMGKHPYFKIPAAFRWLKTYWAGKQEEEDQMMAQFGVTNP